MSRIVAFPGHDEVLRRQAAELLVSGSATR
jgi:hypothetical protein